MRQAEFVHPRNHSEHSLLDGLIRLSDEWDSLEKARGGRSANWLGRSSPASKQRPEKIAPVADRAMDTVDFQAVPSIYAGLKKALNVPAA